MRTFCVVFLLLGAGAAWTQDAGKNAALARFLVEAKKHTYAQGDSAAVKPVLAGTHQLEYSQGPFLYRDIYVGEAQFAGQEMVYESGKPVWTMSYAGTILPNVDSKDVEAAVKLLHTALMRVRVERPFRGPGLVTDGAYRYANHVEGTLESFFGEEMISRGVDLRLYELHYGGGLVR